MRVASASGVSPDHVQAGALVTRRPRGRALLLQHGEVVLVVAEEALAPLRALGEGVWGGEFNQIASLRLGEEWNKGGGRGRQE